MFRLSGCIEETKTRNTSFHFKKRKYNEHSHVRIISWRSKKKINLRSDVERPNCIQVNVKHKLDDKN